MNRLTQFIRQWLSQFPSKEVSFSVAVRHIAEKTKDKVAYVIYPTNKDEWNVLYVNHGVANDSFAVCRSLRKAVSFVDTIVEFMTGDNAVDVYYVEPSNPEPMLITRKYRNSKRLLRNPLPYEENIKWDDLKT